MAVQRAEVAEVAAVAVQAAVAALLPALQRCLPQRWWRAAVQPRLVAAVAAARLPLQVVVSVMRQVQLAAAEAVVVRRSGAAAHVEVMAGGAWARWVAARVIVLLVAVRRVLVARLQSVPAR